MITTSATKAGQIAKFRAIPIDSQGSPASEYSSAIAAIVRTKRGTNRALRGRAPLARSDQRTLRQPKPSHSAGYATVCTTVTCPQRPERCRTAVRSFAQRGAVSPQIEGFVGNGGAGPRKPGYGPYWARTSDLRLVEPALSQLS